MKHWDRMLTGTILVLGSTGLLVAAAAVFLGIGEHQEREAELAAPARTLQPKNVYVQGIQFAIPFHDDSLTCPVILQDGSLNPAFKVLVPIERTGENVLLFWSCWKFKHSPFEGLLTDYRSRRSDTMPRVRANDWIFSRELGLAHLDEHERIDGWLTEEGWSSEPRVAESVRNALFPALDLEGMGGEYQRYLVTQGPYLVYASEKGLYRADLLQRRIDKLCALENPLGFFPSVRSWNGPRTRFILSPKRVYWIDFSEGVRTGSFPRSEAMSDLEDCQVAAGWDVRMIVRRKLPSPQRNWNPHYHVRVFSRQGEKLKEYEYAVTNGMSMETASMAPDIMLELSQAALARTQAVEKTVGGVLFQAILPPALEGMSSALNRYVEQAYGRSGDAADSLLQASLWKSLPLCALLSFLVGRSSRRRSRSWLEPALWSVLTLALGVAAALAYAVLFGRDWATRCPGCSASISPRFSTCPRCSAPAQSPDRLGIEIIETIGSPIPR